MQETKSRNLVGIETCSCSQMLHACKRIGRMSREDMLDARCCMLLIGASTSCSKERASLFITAALCRLLSLLLCYGIPTV
jgi:hypothetical protein